MPHQAMTLPSLVAWCALAACGPPPAAETASDLQRASLGVPASAALVVGCWGLEWSVYGFPPSATGELPDSIRLRDEVVFGTRERLLSPATYPTGRSASGAGPEPWEARFVVNRWWIEDGALRLRFSDGEQDALNATLSVDSNDPVGSGRLRSDPDPPGGDVQAGVRASRIDCAF